MNKKILLLAGTFLIIIAAVVIGLGGKRNQSKPSQVQPASPKQVEPTDGQTVTKTGTLSCLEHKDTSGPQTNECAFGLKQDDGTAYGLGSDDPMLIGSLPTGQQVEVTGKLTPATPSKYATSGTIQVQSVKRL
jgi:hypothetical protein